MRQDGSAVPSFQSCGHAEKAAVLTLDPDYRQTPNADKETSPTIMNTEFYSATTLSLDSFGQAVFFV